MKYLFKCRTLFFITVQVVWISSVLLYTGPWCKNLMHHNFMIRKWAKHFAGNIKAYLELISSFYQLHMNHLRFVPYCSQISCHILHSKVTCLPLMNLKSCMQMYCWKARSPILHPTYYCSGVPIVSSTINSAYLYSHLLQPSSVAFTYL